MDTGTRRELAMSEYPLDGMLYVASSWRNLLYDGVIAVLKVAHIPHYDFRHPQIGRAHV